MILNIDHPLSFYTELYYKDSNKPITDDGYYFKQWDTINDIGIQYHIKNMDMDSYGQIISHKVHLENVKVVFTLSIDNIDSDHGKFLFNLAKQVVKEGKGAEIRIK